jgi:hypothetical protein
VDPLRDSLIHVLARLLVLILDKLGWLEMLSTLAMLNVRAFLQGFKESLGVYLTRVMISMLALRSVKAVYQQSVKE